MDGPPLPRVAHLRDEKLWPDPPPVAGVGRTVRALPVPDRPRQVFDLALFEQLNAEYADRPLVPAPPTYTHDSLTAAARRRVGWVHRMVDLAGTRCLEIGCGNGYEVWYAANALGAQAHGVDVREYGTWETLRAHGARLELADLAVASPYEDGSFDRLLSFTVWEHVLHPYAMLAAAHRLLRPGGLFWLRANLYAGPQASHRYRDVFFPWPHLLFSDDVADEFFRSRGRPQVGWAWVNRLSWLHYRHYLDRLGFRVRHLQFWETPIDEPFYARFEDVLGRYPRRDLTRDYFLAVLEKPA